jgi:hypothetical protein
MLIRIFAVAVGCLTLCGACAAEQPATEANAGLAATFDALNGEYQRDVAPLVAKFCGECHTKEPKEGDLDLTRFAAIDDIRREPAVWQKVAEKLELGEMPPEDAKQPSDPERKQLQAWIGRYLKAEGKAGDGDPGHVVLRRLSNIEYTNTVRALTGVELDPAREFPVDGAAGEGFTNAGEALVMSPALLTKYFDAAKEIAEHAVLLPDGIRFSPNPTRRDWTNEAVEKIRAYYRRHTHDSGGNEFNKGGYVHKLNASGTLPIESYLTALLEEREALAAGSKSTEAIAAERKLNAKYFGALWNLYSSETASPLIDQLRERWKSAKPADAAALAGEIREWQKALSKFQKIGHFKPWMVAVNPTKESLPAALTFDAPPEQWEAAFDDFRRWFPAGLCYVQIVPIDEPVTLELLHRDDEPFCRLLLEDKERAEVDRLWDELRYISQDALALPEAFEQLMEYATQDSDPKLYEPFRKPIADGAAAFRQLLIDTEPRHVEASLEFAAKAYRRPLTPAENEQLRGLYRSLRGKELPHDEALRTVLARILIAPAFLYRVETVGEGAEPQPLSDWELASRLSYFLWASPPDDELRKLAAEGKLYDPAVLVEQSRRMLRDNRVRHLAAEFACQWLGIRDVDKLEEKSERHFPTFVEVRSDLYEEGVQFFADLFQRDGEVHEILDADHTFLNERVAKHYEIPGVEGADWRRVDGLQKHARGGVMGMGATLAKQSGASRTSPILRGNWVLETLLGEKLPKPPKDVPILPDEVATDGLTVRQLVEKHRSVASCARCHDRIDPFGFALEGFDAIGRRVNDSTEHPNDTRVKLKDGTEFADIAGLREYLLTQRREQFERHFCRKLLGYSLGRGTQLSDEPLLDTMLTELKEHDDRFSAAVEAIVRSRQFRYHRGTGKP